MINKLIRRKRFPLRWLAAALLFPPCMTMAAPTFSEKGGGRSEAEVFSTAEMRPFEGYRIQHVRIHGLDTTRERAVRWLMGGREGEIFHTDRWMAGIHKLYNTAALYEIRTEMHSVRSAAGENEADIDLFIRDRWTLLPFATFAGGGGSSNLGGGLFDTNLGGYFVNGAVGVSTLDGVYSFDVSLYQEWFLGSDYSVGVDISRTGTPLDVLSKNGDVLQSFTWFRNQQQLLIGKHFGEDVRLQSYEEFYTDTILNRTAGDFATVYPGQQYRLRPNVIIGRSNLSNFLEDGYEITVSPTFANFLDSSKSYYQGSVSYKRAWILPPNNNFGFLFSGGVMTSTPAPYLFRLGGFDSVRGFGANRVLGKAYVNSNIEYRPLLWIGRFPYFDLDRIAFQGAVFSDIGEMWDPSAIAGRAPQQSPLGLVSAGVGLRGILVKFSNAIVRLDIARTISPSEGLGYSFGVGQFF